jgi:FdhE protein
MPTTHERWIAAHPFLENLARFQAVLDGVPAPAQPIAIPTFDVYAGDHGLGVPLLHSATARVDVGPAGPLLAAMARAAAAAPLPEKLSAAVKAIDAHLAKPGAAEQVVRWAVSGDGAPPPAEGIARFLAWRALARSLAPVVTAYARWRDEDRWAHGICPTCGAPPAMAQLVEHAAGRARLLACSLCETRWKYRRVGCPSCEQEHGRDAGQKIDLLELEGDEPLRIDACQDCKGYLKTYLGQGEEELYLADWTTLHLDVLASQRGLVRRGAALYEL